MTDPCPEHQQCCLCGSMLVKLTQDTHPPIFQVRCPGCGWSVIDRDPKKVAEAVSEAIGASS